MTLLRLSLATTLLVVGAVTLQAQEARKSGPERYREAVKKFDKNKNGKLDGDEREAFMKAFRERLAERKKDGDNDKQSDKSKPATNKRPSWGGPQRGPGQRGPGWGGPQRGPGQRGQSWGGPKRGAGNPWGGDWEARRKEAMKKYDGDKDGKLSETERREMFAAMRKRFEDMREQWKKRAEEGRKAAPWSNRRPSGSTKTGDHGKHDHAKHDHAKHDHAKGHSKQDHGKRGHGSRRHHGRHQHHGNHHGHRGGSHHRGHDHSRSHDDSKQKGQPERKARPSQRGDKPSSDRADDRSREERLKAMVGGALNRAMSGDKNKDGKLNADEFPSRTAKPFGFYDTNSDGYVTRTELLTGIKKNIASSRDKRQ